MRSVYMYMYKQDVRIKHSWPCQLKIHGCPYYTGHTTAAVQSFPDVWNALAVGSPPFSCALTGLTSYSADPNTSILRIHSTLEVIPVYEWLFLAHNDIIVRLSYEPHAYLWETKPTETWPISTHSSLSRRHLHARCCQYASSLPRSNETLPSELASCSSHDRQR